MTFTENLDSMTTVSLFYTILNEFAVMISVCVRSDCLDLSLLSFYQWLVRVVVVPSQLRGTILYSKDSYFVFKWKCIFYLFFLKIINITLDVPFFLRVASHDHRVAVSTS